MSDKTIAIIGPLAEALQTRQTKTLASGIDLIMADLRENLAAPERSIDSHHTAMVLLYEMPRDPRTGEAGFDCAGFGHSSLVRHCFRLRGKRFGSG